MTPDPVRAKDAVRESSNLTLRILAGVVLAPLTIAAAYFGGWLWAALATLATAGMYAEWLFVVQAIRPRVVAAGIAPLVVAGIALALGLPGKALLAIAVGLIAIALVARVSREWALAGLLYAVAALFGAVLVRADPQSGFIALLFVLLIVWVTDIGGYFAGRSIGGPKLWVRGSLCSSP